MTTVMSLKLEYWLVEWTSSGDDGHVVQLVIDLSVGRALMTSPGSLNRLSIANARNVDRHVGKLQCWIDICASNGDDRYVIKLEC